MASQSPTSIFFSSWPGLAADHWPPGRRPPPTSPPLSPSYSFPPPLQTTRPPPCNALPSPSPCPARAALARPRQRTQNNSSGQPGRTVRARAGVAVAAAGRRGPWPCTPMGARTPTNPHGPPPSSPARRIAYLCVYVEIPS
ncbi:proline-rich receptor-like protein kinase PERK12 [Iris pallida]|uniref:Proline-rich receptor-like protein kinase PERK12 n=1 Tax=Iris pallida TaxID=29817 RepID=A0AAX6GUA3_IRIPA|nr:proline-rich receptor-like protein kinase PERK12 [Iris pallida]